MGFGYHVSKESRVRQADEAQKWIDLYDKFLAFGEDAYHDLYTDSGHVCIFYLIFHSRETANAFGFDEEDAKNLFCAYSWDGDPWNDEFPVSAWIGRPSDDEWEHRRKIGAAIYQRISEMYGDEIEHPTDMKEARKFHVRRRADARRALR